jgi:hypothetical protein
LIGVLDSLDGYGMSTDLKVSMMKMFLDRYRKNDYLITFFRYPVISGLIDVKTAKECDQVLMPFLDMCIGWCLSRLANGLDGPSEKKVLAFTLNRLREYLCISKKKPLGEEVREP